MVILTTILTLCMQACILDESAQTVLMSENTRMKRKKEWRIQSMNGMVQEIFPLFFLLFILREKNTDIRQSYQNLLSEYTHMNGTVSACKTRERKKIISDGFSPISYRESAAISFN